jgi:hypothetical protein
MKYLFLDFDGVVVVPPELRIPNRARLALLHEIVDATGAEIVVSSCWRIGRSRAELQGLLRRRVRDVTPIGATSGTQGSRAQGLVVPGAARGNEIAAWLGSHEAWPSLDVSFAVLDDGDDRGVIPAERWFQTDYETGLTPEIARRVIDALGVKS